MTELSQLKELYLNDLRKLVPYKEGKIRPRARRVNAVWSKIQSTQTLNINDYEDVWVWSDTHFCHTNIIKYCERPFINSDEMDQTIIQNHNEVVKTNDLVIWVGDVAFANDTIANNLLAQLNGERILIIGNHDIDRKGRIKKLDFNEIHLLYALDDPICPLVFTHYIMENAPLPWINVHGHVHNSKHNCESSLQHVNVSIEVLNYKPINLNDLKNIAKTRLTSIE